LKKVVTVGLLVCLGLSLAGCASKKENATAQSTSKATSNTSRVASSKKKTHTTGSSTKETDASQVSSSASVTSSSSRESTTASSTSQVEKTLWDAQKSAQLQAYMQGFSQTMNQNYQSYLPGNSVNLYGVQVPDEVLSAAPKMPFAVGQSLRSASWSQTGESTSEYTIVACYSDAATQPYLGKHVYFFAYHQGQPIVLVTMQNQGMPDGGLHFNETQNQDIKAAFAEIANR
jgi:hypothetical protein